MKLSELPILNEWRISPFKPEITSALDMKISLFGIVSNSIKFNDGADIQTSYIKGIAEVEGERVVVTHSGSHYRLGKPSPFMEREFPEIKDQVLSLTGKRGD